MNRPSLSAPIDSLTTLSPSKCYGKRIVRRKVYRSTNSVTGRFLRKLGL